MTPSTISVAPSSIRLPEPLSGLSRLAFNLAWAWVPGIREVFDRLEPMGREGPVAALVDATNLEQLAKDADYVRQVNEAVGRLDSYLAHKGRHEEAKVLTAYFCAEYGFHETFPVYCGGLGILAGDHCKEASDLGLPFVAIGIYYRRGFFLQTLDKQGRQEHNYPRLRPERNPVQRVLDPSTNEPLTIAIEFPGRTVHVAVWLVAVGRTPVLMLDTDLPENSPEDRPITHQLYMDGRDMRVHQEIVLGVGGVRVLEALKLKPTIFHMNEGHSAFLLMERLRRGESVEDIRRTSVLTIHTPVPEGNERFDTKMISSALSALQASSPVPIEEILRMGLDSVGNPNVFDMTAFALRLTKAANGVSLLHGQTADKTWRKVAKRKVIGVTNGVHMPTWVGPSMRQVLVSCGAEFTPALDLKVREKPKSRPDWPAVEKVSDELLWRAHQEQKQALIDFARYRLADQFSLHGEGPSRLSELLNALDANALTIGFARRFAPYKRATLLFAHERRLAKLLDRKDRPVQILFAGKAHPADREGQKMIAKVYDLTQKPRWKGRVFLLEDYDMEVGRMLVQGVDFWLNNPRRPLEASGTSGMKAAANGVFNVSILDGWWDEAYEGGKRRNGFAIGDRKVPSDRDDQDKADADALLSTLEDVIPMYYDRDSEGLPREWIRVMKSSIATSLWAFSTSRMIDDYVKMYSE